MQPLDDVAEAVLDEHRKNLARAAEIAEKAKGMRFQDGDSPGNLRFRIDRQALRVQDDPDTFYEDPMGRSKS